MLELVRLVYPFNRKRALSLLRVSTTNNAVRGGE